MIVNTRADCCSARAGYRVVLPATSARPEPAELFFCAHHRRASRDALAAQNADVLLIDDLLAPV